MISVIISTYNRSEKLKKAIQSVLDQSYQDFEIIIVDDASTDNTEEVVKSFNDKRIKYKKRETNFGCDTKPKNEGFLLSDGEYINFLDDDNQFRKDHLYALVNELEKNQNVAGVYGDRWLIDERNEIPQQLGVSSDFNPNLIMQRNYIDTADMLLRREAFAKVGGFDERYRKYIDWNLWVRLVKYGYSLKRVPIILTDYYICSDSKSLRKEDEKDFNKPAWSPFDCEIELPYIDGVEEPKVAVFTLTYDRLKLTKECLPTLYSTAGYKFDHFIVDNGSKDGTVSYLKTLKNPNGEIKLILNDDNKGISIASNQALDLIQKEDYQIIVKVDNDAYFKNKGWLKRMVDIWKSNHRLALSCYIEGLRDNPGGSPREVYGTVCGEYVGMTKHLGGICHFVDARAYNNFRWNINSTLHGIQDLELSRHLLTNGFHMGYMENWYCEHKYGTEGQHKMFPEYFERRKKEKVEQYSGDKNPNTEEHWNLVYKREGESDPNLRNDTFSFKTIKDMLSGSKTTKLLDVGCGNGYFLSYIKDLPFNLYGIDLSEEGIKVAQKRVNANLRVGNITKLPYNDNEFDYTVSTEVLEHITDLESVVREIARVTKGVSINMFPYKNTIPSTEHINIFDETNTKELFEKYFSEVEVLVLEHPTGIYYEIGDSEPKRSKLILVRAVK